MRKRRKFFSEVVNHIYQRTIDGSHLFYSIEDYLVFYTIFSVCAKTAEIKPILLCIMHNHFHCLAKTKSRHELSNFFDHFTAWYVREYNQHIGRKGKLLKKNFGSAPKWEEKRLRSCIIYIGNNPVEKQFCKRAQDYRWNFIAYARSANPFSEKIIKRRISYKLSKALKEVDNMHSLNLPLKYAPIIRLTEKLNDTEFEQFTDYVISRYSTFDYNELISHFKSYDSMLLAMESSTGEDFDISESRDTFSLKSFNEMMSHMEKKMPRHKIRKITTFPIDEKIEIYKDLQKNTSASGQQICNFLHIKTEKPKKQPKKA